MPVDGQKRPLRVQTAMLMFTRRMLAPLTGAIALSLTTGGGLSVGAAPADTRQQTPTFRASINLVTTDVIARDSTNQFIADLKAGEIAVYEDGVKQELVSLVLMHGRRVFNLLSPPAEPVQAGIILPQRRPSNDATGRVF